MNFPVTAVFHYVHLHNILYIIIISNNSIKIIATSNQQSENVQVLYPVEGVGCWVSITGTTGKLCITLNSIQNYVAI
jgi:hypothetical protein